MDKRYIVKFIRCDAILPKVEKYYYWNREEAENHLSLFREDDSDFPKMYDRIQLIAEYGRLSTVAEEIRFH